MIDRVQDFYISLLTPFIRLSNRVNEKFKYRAITACFIIDIVMFCIVRFMLQKANYFYNTFCGIFLMLIIIFLSLDKPLERIPWRKSMWYIWLATCVWFTISDVVVVKPECGLGIILGVLFTALFFVWQNHSRRDLLWKCFKDALKITFLIMVVLSFLFRPYFVGGRYAGIFTNPNTFGLYMYVLFAVYMSDMDWFVETARPLKKQIFAYIQIAIVVFFISVSQARTAMIAVVSILIVWVICRILIDRKRKNHTPFLKSIALMILIIGMMYPVCFTLLNTIPNLVGHPIVFQDDALYMQSGEKIDDVGAKLLEEEEHRKHPTEMPGENPSEEIPDTKGSNMWENNVLVRSFYSLVHMEDLNRLSSGRISIYKAYVLELNLFGHNKVEMDINGHVVAHAHNNWLQFGYTYGIPGMILYTLVTILGLFYSIRFFFDWHHKFASYCFLPVAILIGYIMATLTECLFQPFGVFPAFAFWFSFGDMFLRTHRKKERE